jgi:hypothetical protein
VLRDLATVVVQVGTSGVALSALFFFCPLARF